MSATVAATLPFTKRVQDTSSPPRSFKWTLGPDKHEIHAIVLASPELADMLPHCLEVPSIIRMEALDDDVDMGPSLFNVFPRTLSNTLRRVWDNKIASNYPPPLRTSEEFDNIMLLFIAEHSSAADRHELVAQLLSPSKPRGVSVTEFHYRLLELNGFVDWLPGTDAKLNDHQTSLIRWHAGCVERAFHHRWQVPWSTDLAGVVELLSQPGAASCLGAAGKLCFPTCGLP
jgi:hypothetical protein